MVCPKCGSPVSPDDTTCSNCGSDLDQSSRSLDVKSEGLKRMTQELKAVGASPQIFPAGETIAERFEIEELVERGPFGEVYKAWDELVETDVALKVFDEEIVSNPVEREEFLSATHAARAMTQKNVVRLHDSGVHRDHPWVSMQYLEGLTLRKALELREKKGERFTLEELEPVVTQITMALQHIGREFPNGNLKPTNVFFLPDLLKVTDGYILAAVPGDVFAERLSESRYVAPELHTSTDQADARCDVYSLGVIIGEMLFGPDYQAGSERISDPEDSAIDALCRRATAFDPAERYPSVEALSEDFSTLVDTGQLLDRGSMISQPPGAPQAEPEPTIEDDSAPVEFEEIPEEEIATREYGRDMEGEPAGPEEPTAVTDSVGPAGAEGPPAAPADGPPAAPGAEEGNAPADTGLGGEESAGGESPAEDSADEGGAPPPPDEPPGGSPEDGDEDDEPAGKAAAASGKPDEDKSSGTSPQVAVGALIGVALVVAIFVGLYLPGDSEEVENIESSSNETTSADEESSEEQKKADKSKDEDKDKKDKGPEPEQIRAAVDESQTGLLAAASEAGEAAKEKGEELAEKEKGKEQNKDQKAVASSGGRQGQGSDRTGSAGSTGGGNKPIEKPEPARGTNCPSGMALVKANDGNYCIDQFEFPGRGRIPSTNVTWFGAQKKCRQQGKRLCTLREWRKACGVKYPWGSNWDPDRCNTQDSAGFARSLAKAGKFKRCRSWSGAHDMVGNVAEWVKEQKIVGGGFGSGKEVATCRYQSRKSPGSGSPNVGFRCCAVPD